METARTADELRLAQSVLLPLELGLSIEQTARAIGRSSGATCTMRTRFGRISDTRYCRARRRMRPMVKAMLTHQYTYAYGAGWHQSKSFAFPENLRLHFLAPYSPKLNPQERIWDELREKYFHNKAFDSLDALQDQLLAGVRHLENNLRLVNSITSWDWILNSASNAN